MIDYSQALVSLYKNCSWEQHGYDYSGLVWKDENTPKPTEEELATEYNRLKSDYDSKEYQRLREKEYPPIVDQLDMIFHGGLDAWKAQVQAVKDKYPKPE